MTTLAAGPRSKTRTGRHVYRLWIGLLLSLATLPVAAQTLTMTPDNGAPGDVVQADGSGFTATDIELWLVTGGAPTLMATINVGRDGEFSEAVTVPTVTPGLWDVEPRTLAGAPILRTPFTVNPPPPPPSLAVIPLLVSVGQSFDITGSNFSDGEMVDLRLQGRNGVNELLAPVTADASGDFMESVTTPTVPEDDYEVVAVNGLGTVRARTDIEVGTLSPGVLRSLPGEGQPGAEINVQGSALLAGEQLTLLLMDGPSEAANLGQVTVGGLSTFDTTIQVPEVEAMLYQLVAEDASNTVRGQIPFTVLRPPSLLPSPGEAYPGDAVTVDLSGLMGNRINITLDGIPVLGPEGVAGSTFFDSLIIPDLGMMADFPTQLTATVQSGTRVTAIVSAPFTVLYRNPTQTVEVADVTLPTGRLRPGQFHPVSGRITVPEGDDPTTYQASLAWRSANGTRLPVNPVPLEIAPDGSFAGVVDLPTILGGFPEVDQGGTDTVLDFVFLNPKTGESDTRELGGISYTIDEFEDNLNNIQTLQVTVLGPLGGPIEDATILVGGTVKILPQSAAENTPVYQPDSTLVELAAQQFVNASGPALGGHIDQISSAFTSLFEVNELTGCPVTLANGLTDANGQFDFTISTNDTVAQILAQHSQKLAEQNLIPAAKVAPEQLNLSVVLSAAHLGFADANAAGKCAPRRFDINYNYDDGKWRFRTATGELLQEFDPDSELIITLPSCTGPNSFPTAPLIAPLPEASPVTINGDNGHLIEGFRSFPDVNGAEFTVFETPRLEQPYSPGILGDLEDIQVTLQGPNGPLNRPMTATVGGNVCVGATLHYGADLPELITWPGGQYVGEIFGFRTLDGEKVGSPVVIDIQRGPLWINNDTDFENRRVQWFVGEQRLYADEKELFDASATASNVGLDIGSLQNDHYSQASLYQRLTPNDNSRVRNYGTATTAIDNDAKSIANTDSITSTDAQPFGLSSLADKGIISDAITILSTGKIPIFRYGIAIPPFVSLTMGANFWATAELIYGGSIAFGDSDVSVDLSMVAQGTAGIDVFLDLSALFDIFSATLFALPQVEVAMPFALSDNTNLELDACFTFYLDVAAQISAGYCPLCLKVEKVLNILEESAPNNCQISNKFGVLQRPEIKGITAAPQLSSADSIGLAADQAGEVLSVWRGADGNLQAQLLQSGIALAPQVLDAGVGAQQPQVAYFGPGQAIVAWAESKLSEQDFLALQGSTVNTPGGTETSADLATAAAQQRLMYRVWENGVFSPPMVLTDTGGDGGLSLAGCPSGTPNCPAGGEVIAVWTRDVAGDVTRHDFRIYTAIFNGVGFSSPAAVDPGSMDKESQGTAAYVAGQPVVVYVRNPGAVYIDDDLDNDGEPDGIQLNLTQRKLYYRFLDQPAGALEVPGAPGSVAWPSVAATPDNGLLISYTEATDPGAFIGTRSRLVISRGSTCIDGECLNWSSDPWEDSSQRNLFVEKPSTVVDGLGNAHVSFRQLGTSGAVLESDPKGVIMGTGAASSITFEVAQLETPTVGDSNPLSIDGLVNWKVASVFDPSTNSVITMAVKEQALAAKLANASKSAKTSVTKAYGTATKGLGDGVTMFSTPALPEFEVLSAEPSASFIDSGSTITINVTVRNNGVAPAMPAAVTVEARWDTGLGTTISADSSQVANLAPGMPSMLSLEVALPVAFASDQARTLEIVINPDRSIDEADFGNNARRLTIGAMPVPVGLNAAASQQGKAILLSWDAVIDPRVSGYRVYRRGSSGVTESAGFSTVNGFADLEALPNETYTYWVVSSSNNLVESELGQPVAITLGLEQIFSNGFE